MIYCSRIFCILNVYSLLKHHFTTINELAEPIACSVIKVRNMSRIETSLIPLIYEVIEEPKKWYQVLEAICRQTGASKGVLFLRNRLTAKLFIPPRMENHFESPLLYNFDEEYIQSFVETYSQLDPWTPIEKLYHPFRPYALSSYLPIEKLRESQFWEWLEPQGITDTVVTEIGMLQKQWIGLNIYFAYEDDVIRNRVLQVLTELLPHLRKAWQVAEIVREGTLAINRSQRFLETLEQAAVLIHHDGSLISANEKARHLDESPVIFLKDQMHFKSSDVSTKVKETILELDENPNERQMMEFDIEGYSLTLSRMGPIEDILGMDTATRLLVFKPNTIGKTFLSRPIWDNPIFSDIEKELVYHLAHGGTVKEFKGSQDLSRFGSDYHWRTVKKLLQVKHPREIFAIHRVFSASNYGKS